MKKLNEIVSSRIIHDMSEGVMLLGMNGMVQYLNPAAEQILGITKEECASRKFAEVFFTYTENEDFIQTILDAIYDSETKHDNRAVFRSDSFTRELFITSSYLKQGNDRIGVIVVINDITETIEMETRHTREIVGMVESFVKAMSTAIEERSLYTASHTRNMVRMAAAFIDWLNGENGSLRFDEEEKNAFLMSVWLHDVGKLAVPVEVMDKATRLGHEIERFEARFERIRLLERIEALEGKITQEEYAAREKEREDAFRLILRVNTCGFLSDEDLAAVQALGRFSYTEEDGSRRPMVTPSEVNSLSIRKGTLTDEERKEMQNHVVVTRRILERVRFPEGFASVTEIAASHHELLDGTGYPRKLKGDEIRPEVRLLTIMDIFEALTAKDRPYKGPVPVQKALHILEDMAAAGSIDKGLLALFEKSRAWEAEEEGGEMT